MIKVKNILSVSACRFLLKTGMVMISMWVTVHPLTAQLQPASEYQVKAVFLYNFSRFVDWPQSAFENSYSPFIIGIIGEDPFGPFMEEAVKGERIGAHIVKVMHFQAASEAQNCHILYMNTTDQHLINQIMYTVSGSSVLTVSDIPDFTKWGGMIRFFTGNNRIRLEINNTSAKNVGLKISSKLLRVADVL